VAGLVIVGASQAGPAVERVSSPAESLSARKALAAGGGSARERALEPGSLTDLLTAR
jgi:hypothetical protein